VPAQAPAPPKTASCSLRRRKKILFVAHSGSQGGAEYCLDTLVKNLQPAKYDVTVLFAWDGPMVESARAAGFRVEVQPLNWWMCWEAFSFWYFKTILLRTAWNIAWLVRWIQRKHIDLVYSNSAVIFEAAVAARIAGVPHLWHVHEVLRRGNVTRPLLPLRLIKRLIRWLSRTIIFESHASRAAYEGDRRDPRCAVVHNCVRFPDRPTALERDTALGKLGFHREDRVVSFLGQFSERKNPLLLVRAAARLADRSNLRFLFVGEGPLREELVRAIDRLGLGDCCGILPFQQEVTWVLSATDVVVLPSRQESFGLVLVEAAALGKPAIATRTEGPSEIIVDEVTGFLVNPDDESDLARRLVDIFGPEVNRDRMGQAAAARARELFSAEEYARKIEGILDEALADPRPNAGPVVVVDASHGD
jgi:glycosyltransferase involved in cell wall biosynthesis